MNAMTTKYSPSDARDNLDSVFGSLEMEMAAELIIQHARLVGTWDLCISPRWFTDADAEAAAINGHINNHLAWNGLWALAKYEWLTLNPDGAGLTVTDEFIERVTEV